jgi:hypothetical protein
MLIHINKNMPFWKRKRKSSIPPVILCPKCLKPTLKQGMNVSGWMAPVYYYCPECKYQGPLYVEMDPEETGENFIDLEKWKQDFPEGAEKEGEHIEKS